jgi:hypothetical protein
MKNIIGYNRNKEYSKTTIIFNDKCKLSKKKVSSKISLARFDKKKYIALKDARNE